MTGKPITVEPSWPSRPVRKGLVCDASLSLLIDHGPLLPPKQPACLEHRQPAHTVGSLIYQTQIESLVQVL